MSRASNARVFWSTAVPFGLAMAIPRFGHFPILYSVAIATVTGALFGGAMVWMQQRAERRLQDQGIDPSDLSPVQERSEEIDGDLESVYSASRRALQALRKVRLVKDNPVTGELDAKTGMTFNSFGESISVRITGDGPQTTVHISSRPRLSTTTVDGGKAAENIGLFFQHLHSELGAPAPNNRWRGP
jgi:hypothetical protein